MLDLNIEILTELSEKMREVIERSFLHTVQEIEDHEVVYIKNKISGKVQNVRKHKLSWVVEMADYYQKLFDILLSYENNEIDLSPETFKIIAAALFYFINPYDVIPDFMKNVGYLDDFYILVLCLERIKEQDKNVVHNALCRDKIGG